MTCKTLFHFSFFNQFFSYFRQETLKCNDTHIKRWFYYRNQKLRNVKEKKICKRSEACNSHESTNFTHNLKVEATDKMPFLNNQKINTYNMDPNQAFSQIFPTNQINPSNFNSNSNVNLDNYCLIKTMNNMPQFNQNNMNGVLNYGNYANGILNYPNFYGFNQNQNQNQRNFFLLNQRTLGMPCYYNPYNNFCS